MKKLVLLTSLISLAAFAGQTERAKAWAIHNRIAGVPPTPTVLAQMESMLVAGNPAGAVNLAMTNQNFLLFTMKNWLKPWSNQEQTKDVALNDFVALAVGTIRDNRPFNEILSVDAMYISNLTGVAAPNNGNNDHFRDIESNVGWPGSLVRVAQSTQTGMNAAGVAGAITTRGFGEAYFSAGTNRRMTRYLFKNFLCKDFENVHDVTVPDYRVRRDVERAPGGDSRTYKNKCVGCHAGQDGLGGAWAFHNFVNNQVTYSPGQVQGKYNQNATAYPDGYVTTDDSWINLWATGQNANLGWSSTVPTRGNGAASLGRMIGASRAFAECMASRSFELLCMHKPKDEDHATIQALADDFQGSQNYNMKMLFASTLTKCVVEED